jgi:proline racemase
MDALRLRMLREPRGYPASNCNLLLPPTHPEGDAGFVVRERIEYPAMSGSNTICVVTALIETGIIRVTEGVKRLKLDNLAELVLESLHQASQTGRSSLRAARLPVRFLVVLMDPPEPMMRIRMSLVKH